MQYDRVLSSKCVYETREQRSPYYWCSCNRVEAVAGEQLQAMREADFRCRQVQTISPFEVLVEFILLSETRKSEKSKFCSLSLKNNMAFCADDFMITDYESAELLFK
jgi:hypothetical protein